MTTISLAAPLTIREAFSGNFGFISLACWIFLLVPQLIANYRNQSGESVSIPFMVIWGVGNGCSLIGAAWAGMPPVIILIQMYFCLANVATALQCLYYRRKTTGPAKNSLQGTGRVTYTSSGNAAAESEPLVSQDRRGSLSKAIEKGWFQNVSALFGVVVIGVVVWIIAYNTGAWHPFAVSRANAGNAAQHIPIGPQIFGWISDAICLGARVPQIIKNARRQSTEGLAILFPLLALLANLTYILSILSHSTDPRDLRISSPWLVGCTAAMGMDLAIIAQFYIYAHKSGDAKRVSV